MAILSVMMVLEELEVAEVVLDDFCAEVTGGDSCDGDRGREFLESDLADLEDILRWELRGGCSGGGWRAEFYTKTDWALILSPPGPVR